MYDKVCDNFCQKMEAEAATACLEGRNSTTELLPHGIGVRGLEPRTSWSQTRRATNCATPRRRA